MEEQGPEAGAPEAEQETEQDAASMPKKRKRRIVIGVVIVIVIAVLVLITLSSVLTTDDPNEAPNPVYQDILNEHSLNSSSLDTAVEQAMVALADYFLTRCQAGISVAVTRHDTRIIVPRGILDVEDSTSQLINQDTLFEIGSVSKPLTGLVLAHEIVAGNLTLDTPLNVLLPDSVLDLVVNEKLVTFRQLVTHTAGFPRLPKNIRDQPPTDLKGPNPYAGYNETDMLREISIAASELSQTGDVEYSNFGFSVLAYLLSRANQNSTSFPALQEDLMNRLGLYNTWIELPAEARQNLSTGYRDGVVVPYWFDGGLFINGGGSTLSSTRDLLTLVELLMTPEDKVQEKDLVETLQLSLESLKPISDDAGVSFAWFYGGTPRRWAHSGATAGFVTYVAFQPETRTGVIAMSNCGDVYELMDLGSALASKLFLIEEARDE